MKTEVTESYFLSLEKVLKRVPFSKGTLYRMMKNQEFPQQRNISSGRVAWVESEVNAWIESIQKGVIDE